MRAFDNIQYLQRNAIDDGRWNSCINTAVNGSIYSYTWYLDAMADNWDGLVLDDYTAVMPLPWRKKWGIAYLYQPFLTAQLGVVGNGVDVALLTAFLHAVPKKFRLWEFPLNRGNLLDVEGFSIYTRRNYVLPLNKPYQELYTRYRENTRRNIKRAERYKCSINNNVSLTEVIDLAKQQANVSSPNDFENFSSLFRQLSKQGLAKTYGVFSSRDELLASAAFLFSHNRAYYLVVGNHPNGRTLGASHALIDAFIRDHAEKDMMLDFEGSDIGSLAFFYSSFGAVEQNYAAIRLNRLPWWAKWRKT